MCEEFVGILTLACRIAPWRFILAFFVAWTVRLATYGLVDSHIQEFAVVHCERRLAWVGLANPADP